MMWFHPLHPPWFLLVTKVSLSLVKTVATERSSLVAPGCGYQSLGTTVADVVEDQVIKHRCWSTGWMDEPPNVFFSQGKTYGVHFWWIYDIYIYVYNSMYIHIIYTYISFMIVMNMSNEISLGWRSISQFVHTTTHFSVWMLSPYHIISPNFLHKQS